MMNLLETSAPWASLAIGSHRSGEQVALMFDFDGTLTPIVRHPSLAVLSSGTRQVLQRLTRLPGVTVAIISGRSLDDLVRLVQVDGAWYAGSGGMEMLLDQRRITHPEVNDFELDLERAHDRFTPVLDRSTGAWIERKPGAMTIHYRNMLPLNAICLRNELLHLLAEFPGLRGKVVSEAIEVSPVSGWHKGDAVHAMLRHLRSKHHQPATAIYFGDAANDEEAMLALAGWHGMTVGVGSDAPAMATCRVGDPEELQHLLCEMAMELESSGNVDTSVERSWPGALVVDPCANDRDRLMMALRKRGWRVWSTGSVVDARDLLRSMRHEIRVALVDYDMPGMSGSRFINEIRQSSPGLVACGMAHVSPYVATAYKRLTRTTLFSKPVAIDKLDGALRDMISNQRPSVQPQTSFTTSASATH